MHTKFNFQPLDFMVSLFKYWLQEIPRPDALASEDVEKTTTQMKAWFALTVKVTIVVAFLTHLDRISQSYMRKLTICKAPYIKINFSSGNQGSKI